MKLAEFNAARDCHRRGCRPVWPKGMVLKKDKTGKLGIQKKWVGWDEGDIPTGGPLSKVLD